MIDYNKAQPNSSRNKWHCIDSQEEKKTSNQLLTGAWDNKLYHFPVQNVCPMLASKLGVPRTYTVNKNP